MVSCLFVFLPGKVLAQEIRFDREDRISEDGVVAITQDSLGYMWFGTWEGLYRFDGYTIKDYRHVPGDSSSLSSSRIETLFIDREGTLWAGTLGAGLNRYDALNDSFEWLLQSDSNGVNLSTQVFAMTQDSQGMIWVGTNNGLYRVDPESLEIKAFRNESGNEQSLSHNQVRSLVVDSEGVLWVGTGSFWGAQPDEGGLNRFRQETNDFERVAMELQNGQALESIWVMALYEDTDRRFWVGTWGNGVYEYDRIAGHFDHHGQSASPYSRPYRDPAGTGPCHEEACGAVRFFKQDKLGHYWIGAFNGGVKYFDPQTSDIQLFDAQPGNASSMQSNEVWTLFEASDGTLWLGTWEGLYKVAREPLPLPVYRNEPYELNTLTHDFVTGLAADSEGDIWVGLKGGGLNRWVRNTKQFQSVRHDPLVENSLSSDAVNAVLTTPGDTLWVGTTNTGLNRWVSNEEGFQRFQYDVADSTSLSNNYISSLFRDAQGVLWVGTFGGGVNRLWRSGNAEYFERIMQDPLKSNSLSNDYVTAVYRDQAGILWIGTTSGLNWYDLSQNQYGVELSEWYISTLYEDSKGRLWVGTWGQGLHQFNKSNSLSESYTQNEGLPGNNIAAINEDVNGKLWVSTADGEWISPEDGKLSVLNAEEGTFQNMGSTFGITGIGFAVSATARVGDQLYFGGNGGIVEVLTEEIQLYDQMPPQIVLSGLRVGNEPVGFSDNRVADGLSPDRRRLVVPHDQDDITFDFVGINYANPVSTRYQYMLEGYDATWRELTTQRSARYSNIKPGAYTFKVKAVSGDGIWSQEEASIGLTINAPWWQRPWAYSAFLLAGLGIMLLIEKRRKQYLIAQERNRARERELEQARQLQKAYHQLKETQNQLVQAEKLASLGQLTSGIAHELKNPLNFVNNFAEINVEITDEILSSLEEELDAARVAQLKELFRTIQSNAEIIQRHGTRANAIVEEMMQHAQQKKGTPAYVPINEMLDEYIVLATHSMQARAPSFQCNIERNYDLSLDPICIIPAEMGRVFHNLLLNAFQAVQERKTSSRGKDYEPRVQLVTAQTRDGVEIHIQDNGPGIDDEIKDRIFEPFFTTRPTGLGKGLGLSQCFDIVTQVHRGHITVTNSPDEGAHLYILLPADLKPETLRIDPINDSSDASNA